MNKQNVILIFDIGKTNKKLLLFNEGYNIIHEESTRLDEVKDEDGFPCEDVHALTTWIKNAFEKLYNHPSFEIKAINFSGYGASFVHLDKDGKVCTPLYNYLKPYPEELKQQFYNTYGGESLLSKQTASPVLGNLNSGLQLYRLKYEKPDVYAQIKYTLHLPQYLSYIISSKTATDITSIGCHTHLWNFQKEDYHNWVYKEAIQKKFPAIYPANSTANITVNDKTMPVGFGLHDSSAALIPYLKSFTEPFILISTGTWCISLNPFNSSVLSDYELHNDCLCFLSYLAKPVKASRLFAGNEHEQQIKRLSVHFNTDEGRYKTVVFDNAILKKLDKKNRTKTIETSTAMVQQSIFASRPLQNFETYEEAYHQLMLDIIAQQVFSTKLVLNNTTVKKIFVDGGFGKNDVFMNLLASAFPNIAVFAASIPQASSLGAALVLHHHVNGNAVIPALINLKYYPAKNIS